MAFGHLIFSHRTASSSSSTLLIPTISRVSPLRFRIPPSFIIPTRLHSSHPSSLPTCFHCVCPNLNHPHPNPHPNPHPIPTSDYRDIFARRMTSAGLKPHHRIAIGVSGGPDSMALCVLAAGWKVDAFTSATGANGGYIEGLLAIIVDHGLRVESKEEANLVCRRVSGMGIRCEVSRCVWPDGRPKQGNLQEAARDMRYQTFQDVCIKHQIGVLLTAHHADDQAELFVIRLSRNSGVLGLAGMAFTSQLFSTATQSYYDALNVHTLLLVRPLLEFLKKDMYKICQRANQEWVEDPSNQSPLFARNRIRMSLRNLSSSFRAELYRVISACRETRSYVDRICHNLINQSVAVMAKGYAIIDLEVLNPSKIEDICLSKFVSLVLQFISQRHRPVRGSASKLLMDYLRTSPCKTSLTAAGCYLCAAPGSKGTKVVVCCSLNTPPPSKMKLLVKHPLEGERDCISSEVEQIIGDAKLYSNNLVPNISSVHFLDVTSSESVLTEARRFNMISDSTLGDISLLRSKEIVQFKSKTENHNEVKHEVGCDTDTTYVSELLPREKFGYFTNRFLVTWNLCREKFVEVACPIGGTSCERKKGREYKHDLCSFCVVGCDMAAEVRPMVVADWLYLAKLSKCENSEQVRQKGGFLASAQQEAEKAELCSKYVRQSARRALRSLKLIPVAARRALPVLVNPQGLLLSVPSVCFRHCPCLEVSAVFKPRVPLGGGHNSFT